MIHVNPTRMELTRLKKRLMIARRGHKLLKDKRDELMKKFLELVRKNKELREYVEKTLLKAYKEFILARSVMETEVLEGAIMYPKSVSTIDFDIKNIMSVKVPIFNIKPSKTNIGDVYPYGFVNTSGELDGAISSFSDVLTKMLELAQIEKSTQLLSLEIEKTRRRVNALEFKLIPELVSTIKFISMKLDESERGSITRLMKVKDMMLKQVRIDKAKKS